MPGRAWLEFTVARNGDGNRLSIAAYYDTSGFAGKIYWYTFLPFHKFIFSNLLKQIEKMSSDRGSGPDKRPVQ